MRRAWAGVMTLACGVGALTPVMEAHKPITSPFTYSADVQPILRQHCGRCHGPGGVAPMSLLTYRDAVPWAESIRVELSAAHMPPWVVDRGAARFRESANLSAHDLNVLLTWASGGTPLGDAAAEQEPAPVAATWALGQPDAIIDLPAVTLGADEQERLVEFDLPAANRERFVRAVDVLPGTPAIVRSAVVDVAGASSASAIHDDTLLALWVPGDTPLPLNRSALRIPSGRQLRVRVRYRKTWSYEGKSMTDRSRLGLYLAPAGAPAVRAATLSAQQSITLTEPMRALAIYPATELTGRSVVLTATGPDGRRDDLIAFHASAGWSRRFWFRDPRVLPRGTRLSVRITPPLATGTVTVNLAR